MPLSVAEVGGLAVAFNPADEQAIQKALQELDPNLFLDQEIEPHGPRGPFVYFCVKEWNRNLSPHPIAVLPWKDRSGPRPLTFAIVEQVKRLEKRDDNLVQRVTEANRETERRSAQERDDAYDEITRDFQKAARNGGNFSGSVHRSQGLRLARDRARRRPR